ncbi:hypothetical protein [Streptomyces sp. NPDC051546]|uniref:hypothetical protein n=1 Tax=Streptomyces sp. NPDC051546 TaxID=3365655 RepID=UPI00379243FC
MAIVLQVKNRPESVGFPENTAGEKILRDILGGEPDQELLDLTAAAGGNSRLLTECATGLVEEGLVKEHGGTVGLTERRVPGRVVAFVKRLLGDLSTDCQRFLKVAAVLGRSFMLEDVSRARRVAARGDGALQEAHGPARTAVPGGRASAVDGRPPGRSGPGGGG